MSINNAIKKNVIYELLLQVLDNTRVYVRGLEKNKHTDARRHTLMDKHTVEYINALIQPILSLCN